MSVVLALLCIIKLSSSEYTEVLASSYACFSASSYESTIFNAPIDGELVGVALRHNSGTVTCNGVDISNYGCDTTFMVNVMHVTDDINYIGETYYPTTETQGVTILNTESSCLKGCNINGYLLDGAHPYANEDIGLMGPSYQVDTTDTFMLQYSEACCQTSISDNSGTSCGAVYFLYNKNCENNGEIKHINWNELQNADNNSAQIPFSHLVMNLDKSTLKMTFDIDLQYVGSSTDGNFDFEYNLGTTYVIGFESFGTHGNLINEPGNCQNRVFDSFTVNTFDQWWGYSEYPYLSADDLSSNTYLSYPPPSEYWTLGIDAYSCTPINYIGTFSWSDLSGCVDYNGNRLIDIEDDASSITLSGTLYVNVISPFSMATSDSGYYRSFPLIQQDFSISILKQINVMSSTGVELFITSIIGIYEDETDESFELSVLTQSADYIQLINPQILNTPFGTKASISSITTSCLVASSYTCGQIFTITINQTEIPCPPGDLSGEYDMVFDVECRDVVEDENVCNAFIDDNNGETLIALQVESNFIDTTCEHQMYNIIFDGSMTFYDDEEFAIQHTAESDDYVIGQNTIYVEVEINFSDDGSGDNYNIFDVEIDNVFVCTANDTSNLALHLNQQNGFGGCLSPSIDANGPYDIITNGAKNDAYNAQIIEYLDESNVVRFSFLTFDIGRTEMYVHVQVTLILQSGSRRRLLLQSMKSETEKEEESDQIRHFIDSATIIHGIIDDKETNVFTTKYNDDISEDNNNDDGTSNKLMKSIKILFIFVASYSVY